MKRHLISQMRNEWRTNIWLIVELAIVSVILWVIYTFGFTLVDIRTGDHGYNLDNIYVGQIKTITEASPEYTPYDSLHSYYTDRNLMLADLRSNPCVEAVGFGNNAMSYNYNYHGSGISYNTPDSVYHYFGNNRDMSPDVIKAIRLRGINGETPEELASILERGELLISPAERIWASQTDPEVFRGKDVWYNNDSTQIKHIGGLAHGLRRNDYESIYNGVIYKLLGENDWGYQLIIRVKDGKDRDFREFLNRGPLQVGNVYVSPITSVESMRAYAHHDVNEMMRNLMICGVFMLLMVFFGFLGTFWFRTQQRTAEIAVRKINGATAGQIFRRFIGEGMILLGIATLPATAIEWAQIHYDVIEIGIELTTKFIIIGWLASAVTLMLLITVGIWMPARRAMSVNPAQALKDA